MPKKKEVKVVKDSKPIQLNWPETLIEANRCQDQYICVSGPVGSGKTSWAVNKIIGVMKRNAELFPRTSWVVIRNTYRELKDTTQKSYFYWYPPIDYEGDTFWKDKLGVKGEKYSFGKYRKSEECFVYEDFANGKPIRAEFYFRSCENENDIGKFKSFNISGFHIDEVIEVEKAVFMILQGRIGRSPMGWPRKMGICTTNPPDEFHWVYKDFFSEEKLVNYSGFKQKPGENKDNLPVNYYEDLREAYKNNPDWINRYIEGNWGVILTGQKVYPEFGTDFHVVDEYKFDKNLPIVRGWDFGLTPSCVFMQLGGNQKLTVFDELQEFNMGVERFRDKVITHCNMEYPGRRFFDYADPAGWKRAETDEKTCIQILANRGIYPQQGEVTFVSRREAVAAYLNKMVQGKPAFQIVKKKCPMLFNGFVGAYCYPDKVIVRQGNNARPTKNEYSHCHDALQYAVSRLLQYQTQWNGEEDWIPKNIAKTYRVA